MTRTVPAALFLAIVLPAVATAETRTVEIGPFQRIGVANGVFVEVAFGAASSVVIEGPADQLDNVSVEIEDDGALRIRPVPRGWFRQVPVDDVVVHVTAESVSGLSAANGARIVIVDVPAETTLDLSAANGASVEAFGACEELTVSAANGARIDAAGLHCRTVTANAAMGAAAHVTASESLTASAAFGGSISYAGEAEDVETTGSMGGAVRRGDR